MYVYFVAYGTQSGVGNVDIWRDKPVTSIEDVREMERAIARTKVRAIIQSWQLLRIEGAEESA